MNYCKATNYPAGQWLFKVKYNHEYYSFDNVFIHTIFKMSFDSPPKTRAPSKVRFDQSNSGTHSSFTRWQIFSVEKYKTVITLGIWESEHSWMECMDAPETVMTTRAPAVLKNIMFFLPGEDQCLCLKTKKSDSHLLCAHASSGGNMFTFYPVKNAYILFTSKYCKIISSQEK